MPKYSIIIPVYKSTKSLEIIAGQVKELERYTGLSFELIFINDCPKFLDTSKTLEKLKEGYGNVKVVTLRKNKGQHIALLIGIKMAIGDYIITMDDDLQHSVSEIRKLIVAMEENPLAEAVFAIPNYKRHNLFRNIGSYILNKIDSLFLKKPKGLIKSSFRIIRKELAEVMVKNYNAMPAISSLIIDLTENIINIEVEHNRRKFGRSNYSINELISLTLNNIIHYSSLPLKAVGVIGIGGFLFSLVFILLVVVRKVFIGIDFPGYASTVSLISFFGGLNLFAVGLIGEYLIRIIKEQQKGDLDSYIKKIE